MSQTRLNVAQLKTLGRDNIATDSELAIAIGEHVLDTNPHPQYLEASSNIGDEKIINRGVPGGYAPLDNSGLIPTAAIPVQTVVTIVQTMSLDAGRALIILDSPIMESERPLNV